MVCIGREGSGTFAGSSVQQHIILGLYTHTHDAQCGLSAASGAPVIYSVRFDDDTFVGARFQASER